MVFAIANTAHTCITPSTAEMSRIKAYCRKRNLPDTITFVPESSDVALPCGQDIPEALDMVFIDGAHRFPLPVIDWYYTASLLRTGGIVAVDDFTMPSVKILFDFLSRETEWKQIQISENTAFFEKLADPYIDFEDDWQHQVMNLTFKKETFDPKPETFPMRGRSFAWIKRTIQKIVMG